jgi:hypothetical protein
MALVGSEHLNVVAPPPPHQTPPPQTLPPQHLEPDVSQPREVANDTGVENDLEHERVDFDINAVKSFDGGLRRAPPKSITNRASIRRTESRHDKCAVILMVLGSLFISLSIFCRPDGRDVGSQMIKPTTAVDAANESGLQLKQTTPPTLAGDAAAANQPPPTPHTAANQPPLATTGDAAAENQPPLATTGDAAATTTRSWLNIILF